MSAVRDSLGIFWKGTEEVGINLYAFLPGEIGAIVSFPLELWPEDAEVRRLALPGMAEGWRVERFLLRLPTLPSAASWSSVVRETLSSLTSRGATVAWCGMEGGFADPPHLFTRTAMPASVWAACSAAGAIYDAPPLDAEMSYLDDTALARLHREVEAARAAELVMRGSEWPPRELWVSFDYAGFWDVPRVVSFSVGWDRIVLDSRFDEASDDYETAYTVYVIDRRLRDLDDPWPGAEGGLDGARRLGAVDVTAVRYDPSVRKRIDVGTGGALGVLLVESGFFTR